MRGIEVILCERARHRYHPVDIPIEISLLDMILIDINFDIDDTDLCISIVQCGLKGERKRKRNIEQELT